MRGKAGPKAPTKKELEEQNGDPTAEEIVGKDNVVEVGTVGEEQVPPEPQGYLCVEAGCSFKTKLLSEMEEHVGGTGHGGYKVEEPVKIDPPQPKLFGEKGIVKRMLDRPLDKEFLNKCREELADLYQKTLDLEIEKKGAVDGFNAKIKNKEERMREIARILATPYNQAPVECEWRIIADENCKKLFRLDTGVVIQTEALTAEDRAEEIKEAEAANAEPSVEIPAESTDEATAEQIQEEAIFEPAND